MSTTFEYDTEIYLPVRLEFTVNEEGEIELRSLTPLVNFLPGCPIDPSALPARERRVLLAEAAQLAENEAAEARLERRVADLAARSAGMGEPSP